MRYWPGVVAVALTATVTVMPGFAVGALAPAIEAELGISRTTVGLMISGFYAATALGSPLAKRVAVRLPAPLSFAVAAVAASVVLLATSQADRPITMAAALLPGGLSNGLVQPVAGRLIAVRVPEHRRSLAAGVVGAALGAATFLPGLLVSLVLPAHGWRTALLAAGVITLVPVAVAPLARVPPGPTPTRTGRDPATYGVTGVLVLWALAAALSATGNNAVATYFVPLGTHAGLSATVTGNLLSLSALLAIAVRLAAGALTDRAPHRNPAVITGMMLAGGLGLALVAISTPVTFVLGAVLAFTAGWGWTGLLLATALRLVAGRAENAGHTVQTGIYTGASIAPYAFAMLSHTVGLSGAALVAAAAALGAATAMAAGARAAASRTVSGAAAARAGRCSRPAPGPHRRR
ncbi:MFS transporter [Micromonospora sp. HM5-17]|uniref:MFS transporter n=1 Tax=Micromonospora sp. HM5-17 TaxID=2487710 RepID=UPI0013158A58|nr:MFS transporter [Micromonospora sp. HM5-17]